MSANVACLIATNSLFEARALMEKLEGERVRPEAVHATDDQIERMMVTEGRKILRAMLQQHCDLRAALEREISGKRVDRQKRSNSSINPAL